MGRGFSDVYVLCFFPFLIFHEQSSSSFESFYGFEIQFRDDVDLSDGQLNKSHYLEEMSLFFLVKHEQFV